MEYFLLKQQTLPRFISACSSSTEKYKLRYENTGHMEITTVDRCGIYLIQDGKKTYVPARSVLVVMPDSRFSIEAAEEGILCDDTVTVELPGQEWVTLKEEMLAEHQAQGEELILPQALPLGDDFTEVSRLIRTLISLNVRDTEASRCMCYALWFELLATLDSKSRNSLFNDYSQHGLPSHQMYIQKAKYYINRHFAEPIRNADVAEALRITPNYLSNIFKEVTGQTIHEFLQLTRVERAKELLARDSSLTMAQVAEETGFASARMLAIHFKKAYGITVGEYMRISNELTLYHPAPWQDEK